MKPLKSISCWLLLIGIAVSGYSADKNPAWWQRAEQEAVKEGYALVTVDEVSLMTASMENLMIVDVRPEYEYEMGHLPGSVNLEFHLGDRMQLSSLKRKAVVNLLGADRARPVVIYCRSYS